MADFKIEVNTVNPPLATFQNLVEFSAVKKKNGASVSISSAYSERENAVARNAAKCSQEILMAIIKDGGCAFPVICARNMNRLLDELEEYKVVRWLK